MSARGSRTAAASQGTVNSTITNFDAAGHPVVRFDTDGNAIDAHDGEIRLFGDTYYLYGTSYDCGFRFYELGPFCGFKVYSSPDLVNWTDRGFLFDPGAQYWQDRCDAYRLGCFRPHVVYNALTGLYVLWFNSNDAAPDYHVFESTSPVGPFVEHDPAHPPLLAVSNDPTSGPGYNGDENLFVDDDISQTAYLVHSDFRRGGDIVVEKLDARYESGTGQFARLGTVATEAPAMFKYDGRYYITMSDPNCPYCGGGPAFYDPSCPPCSGAGTSYMTAPSPLGPWTGTDPSPPQYWRIGNGVLSIDGGAAPGPAYGGDVGLSVDGKAWTDYSFSFDTQLVTPTVGNAVEAGWAFRALYPTDGYLWTLGSGGPTGGTITETVLQQGHVASARAVPLPFAVQGGRWYHVETAVAGQTITTSIDGQVVDVTQDATYARGRVGFEESTADRASALFDNVRVVAPDGATLLADDFSGDLSRFDPPLPRRFPISINPDSCGGQPTHVAVLPGADGPIYLYQSDLWNHGDRNEALANYYWAPLSFDASGNIQPFGCSATVPLTLAVGQPGMQAPPPEQDQTSGSDNFRTLCDVGGDVQRLQTFTPSRTGMLTKVTVTTFQNVVAAGFVHAPLTVDILRLTSPLSQSTVLATATFTESELQPWTDGPVGWAPRDVAMQPDVGVVAGEAYGIRLRSAAPQGCYGFAYNDSSSYARGEELYSADGGSTWSVEPGYTLKFATYVSQSVALPTSTLPAGAPTATGTPTPSPTPTGAPAATGTPAPTATWPPPTYTSTSTPPAITPAPSATPSSTPASASTPAMPSPTEGLPPTPTPTSTGVPTPVAPSPQLSTPSPTTTIVPGPAPPAAGTSVPTASATPMPAAPAFPTMPAPTATRPAAKALPTGVPTSAHPHATAGAKPRKAAAVSVRLVVSASPRTITSGQRLRVVVRTVPRARVTIAVQVPIAPMPARNPSGKKGARPQPVRIPGTPLYRVVCRAMGAANGRGALTYTLRIAYNPAHDVHGLLVVTARAARGTTTRTLSIAIRPARPHYHQLRQRR